MKKIINKSLFIFFAVLFIFGCNDEYLTDGGVSSAYTELTAYEYLKANKYSMFDTLLQIIDTLDLKDSINNAGTFFAPNNYNIELYLEQMTDSLIDQTNNSDTTYTLANLFQDIRAKDLLQYVIDDPISLENATLEGDIFTTYGNTTITIKKEQTNDDQYYVYSDNPVYFLYYCLEGMEEEVCQTQGILTQNGSGAVINVMNNDHVFLFFSEDKGE